MQIILGNYSGFCFGVKRAVEQAEKLKGNGNYLLGEIIHNEEVNQKLKEQGLITVDSLDEVPCGSTLLIRKINLKLTQIKNNHQQNQIIKLKFI